MIYYTPEEESELFMIHIGTYKIIFRGTEDDCKRFVADLQKETDSQRTSPLEKYLLEL